MGCKCDIRGDVLREPFPHEDCNEDGPEEDDALPLLEDAFATVKGVKELDGGEQVGENNVGGIHEESAHDTTKTVSDKLRADQSEDTNADIGFNVVVEVIGSEDTDGKGGFSSSGRENRNGDMFLDV